MKKYLIIIFGCVIFIAVLAMPLLFRESFCSAIFSECTVIVHSKNMPNETVLARTDAVFILNMLNKRVYHRGNLSCGFSEDLSITFSANERSIILYIAQDECPYLYSPEKDRYLRITADDNTALRKILLSYGVDIYLPG